MAARRTKKITIGKKMIGGGLPVLIQSMTNTDTKDIKNTVSQIKKLEELGCDIVRVAIPDKEAAKALSQIKEKINIPLVADIHFDPQLAIESVTNGADKIRINPGNIGKKDDLRSIIRVAKGKRIPVRVGVNSGSLERKVLEKYNAKVTAEALAESAIKSVKLLESFGFKDIVVSAKSTTVKETVETYKILSNKLTYPLHLGVTEAGRQRIGIVKSSLGIGILLLQGIGDTIRVSLTGSPEEEVKVAWDILKSLKLRDRGLSIISCPTCGRTKIPVTKIVDCLEKHKKEFGPKPIKIAVMGCVVNGLGEANGTDFAFVGLKNHKVGFFRKGQFMHYIKKQKIEEFIINLANAKNIAN